MNSVSFLVISSAVAMFVGALSGTFVSIRPSYRLLAALAILLAGFLLLGGEIWRAISWAAAFPFGAGFVLQRYVTICPCGQRDCSHVKTGMMVVIVALMFVHSMFDGHLLAEFTNGLAVSAMLLHKALDGLALAVLLMGYSRLQRWSAIVFAISATPVGLIFLPKEALGPLADALLVSGMLGIYASTAYLIASLVKTVRKPS